MADLFGLVAAFVPLFLILWIANLAEARRQAGEPHQNLAMLAYLLLAMFYLGGILVGVMLQVSQVLLQQQPELFEQLGLFSPDQAAVFDSLGVVAAGIWIPSLLGMLLLTPPLRSLAARVTGLDPAHPVHAVALAMTMVVFINLFLTLGIGLGNLTDLLEEQESGASGAATMTVLWAQQIMTALLALVGVGWLTRRSRGQAFARLGLVRPTGRQVMIGIGAALALVPVVAMAEGLASLIGLGASPDVKALTEQLLGPLFQSPVGILTLGLAAALGEETIFRGAAQPRFGLVLTALLFALLHSNYGITISTAIVFVLGIVLGYLRSRHNTTTAMITHAVYNSTLGLIAYLSLKFLEF